MTQLVARQIHLDYHTSELIPGVGKDFDPDLFAKTAKDAHIASMTVFARCHHGWLYYPSKKFPELVHPNLVRPNLMVEQVKALHKAGVRAPVYITVQWDYHSATTRPEWLIRKADGSHEGEAFTRPGFYQSLCINTGYFDFLAEHTKEVCGLLGDELDGVFFDIVGIRPCLCAACRKEMKQKGVDCADEGAVRAFAKFSLTRFKQKMTRIVRAYSKDCTIFYNAGHVGPCTRDSADTYTHFELESLPSGGWGYLHFPVSARYARTLGLDCMGMTGKFHTSWGDFHSLKNQAALEFECFRMLSYGFAASIGDQLEPQGVLQPATYRLIGSVFGPLEEREPWARPSKAVVEAAVLTAEEDMREHVIPDSVLGASQLLEELALQFDVIDRDQDLAGYKLVIVPEDFHAGPAYQRKLDAFAAAGGKIIACGQGGLSGEGAYPSCFGCKTAGTNELYPDFLLPEGAMGKGLEADAEYAIYLAGEKLSPTSARPVMCARAPFFAREGDRFCSHRYTPSAKGAAYPAVLQNGGVIVFSHPIFTQYRQNAPFWCKQLIANALDILLPGRIVRHDGPSTLGVSVLDQPQHGRYAVHVLSYVPVRKSASIDLVEERTAVRNVTLALQLPKAVKAARLVPEGTPLAIDGGSVTIPEVNGYSIVELAYGK